MSSRRSQQGTGLGTYLQRLTGQRDLSTLFVNNDHSKHAGMYNDTGTFAVHFDVVKSGPISSRGSEADAEELVQHINDFGRGAGWDSTRSDHTERLKQTHDWSSLGHPVELQFDHSTRSGSAVEPNLRARMEIGELYFPDYGNVVPFTVSVSGVRTFEQVLGATLWDSRLSISSAHLEYVEQAQKLTVVVSDRGYGSATDLWDDSYVRERPASSADRQAIEIFGRACPLLGDDTRMVKAMQSVSERLRKKWCMEALIYEAGGSHGWAVHVQRAPEELQNRPISEGSTDRLIDVVFLSPLRHMSMAPGSQ